jgi:hypothetical protein
MGRILTAREVWTKPKPADPERTSLTLTAEEAKSVRAGLHWLRLRHGGWVPLGKVLRVKVKTLQNYGTNRAPSAAVAIRAARLAGIGVDDLLTGRWPGGACPHCGRS